MLDTAGDFAVAQQQPETDTIRQVTLGDLVLRQVPVVGLTEQQLGYSDHPRLGRHILCRFRLTFDNKLKRVYFEGPHRGRE